MTLAMYQLEKDLQLWTEDITGIPGDKAGCMPLQWQ
jgi:hypothetical protein